jgi:hypothetical protein
MIDLVLHPGLDADRVRAEYQARRRVRIGPFMAEDGLRALHGHLVARDDWRSLFIGKEGIVELDRESRRRLGAEEANALDDQIHARACLGFQYRYEGVRIPDADEATGGDGLDRFASFMASPALLGFLAAVLGRDDIAFGEGQATAYAPGDFLTCHDDGVDGRDRLAAFVLGMTPQWRPEWGGLLLFHEDDDAAVHGHVPRFNTLDLFAVPQRHSVSYVNRSAPGRRLALTGWIRSVAQ